MYRCLVCDIPLTIGTFPPHAAWHGWDLDDMRQVGFDWEQPPARIATYEFGAKYGTSLFWMIHLNNPLVEEPDV